VRPFDETLVAGIARMRLRVVREQNLVASRVYLSQPGRQEIKINMSGVNGDKARFNRRRRQKISRRQSNEKMLKALAEKNLVAPAKQASLKEKEA
jgi:hypothetical protein